ncbi:MAG TPA: PDZ domain-containing protein [Vicinamibacterales bacterium]|jgi:predicted metalloprotease with PDZ domain|nr:PDZ domain-containing protein [Vicinamibacterales bacterium]
MASRLLLLLVAAALLMTHAETAAAQTAAEPLRYTLSFPAPQTHYMEVAVAVPTDRRPEVELMMAVWTPGSYLVREYERNVEGVTAAAAHGRALTVVKSDKNRWRVTTGGAATVTVKYRVYAREMSVRTNWVEAGFALVNGAPTFLTLADRTPRAHEVVITPALGWARSMTSLPEMPGGAHRYRAPDFDTLADSPIVIGNPAVHEFTVDGKKHYLVNVGEGGVFDGARAAKDLEAIVREYRRMWGFLPYEKYLFLNLLTESGGGLEHKNSTVLMASRWTTRTRRSYNNWLDLASHEFFHAWNVKRLRPVELGPFDYENEVHTKSLWIAEGVTEYYADLTLHRAGLITRDEYLDSVSDRIEELQTTPGRLVQSAEMASYDAWIKYYRPDENSINTAISYYTKGSVVGLLLDARIRKATNGARSLDDVMKAAYEKYSGMRGYTADEFRGVAEQVAGTSLKSFWDSAVSGTDELDYKDALDTLGLRFRSVSVPADRPGRAWLGIGTRNDAGRLLVTQVRRDTPALAAGLNVDDEILAIDDYRVRADRLDNRLEQYRPGDKVVLLVARREQLLRLELTFGTEPTRAWRLEVNPSASEAQQSSRGRWLNPGRA